MNQAQKRLLIAGGAFLALFLLFIIWQTDQSGSSVAFSQPAATPERLGSIGMITYYQMQMSDGTQMAYGVVQPDAYDAENPVPVLLALPPGPQTQDMVVAGISGYWGQEALDRGWVVVSPIAPNETLFFQGSEEYLPEFLDRIEQIYPPEGGKFHLAGFSNGGISAFRIATLAPDRFHNMVVIPGLAHRPDFDRLDQIADIPVAMFVGEFDTGWIGPMQETATRLEELGGTVSLEIVPEEGHVIQSLSGGERLFDIMEANR